MEGVDHCTYL